MKDHHVLFSKRPLKGENFGRTLGHKAQLFVLRSYAHLEQRHGCSENLRNQTETLSVLFLKEKAGVAAFLGSV